MTLREGADDYPHIVVVLDAKTRVIECATDIQWIAQHRRKPNDWRSRGFYRRSEYLNRDYGPNAVLAALPPMYVEGRRQVVEGA